VAREAANAAVAVRATTSTAAASTVVRRFEGVNTIRLLLEVVEDGRRTAYPAGIEVRAPSMVKTPPVT
jgi:hypothetical protein